MHRSRIQPSAEATPRGQCPAGVHYMLELYDCPAAVLDDRPFIEQAVRDAVVRGGCTLLQLAVHRFEPQGVTAVALLSESHLSIHTWPQHGYAAVDFFTCGVSTDPNAACDLLADRLSAGRREVKVLPRGGSR